MLKTKGNYVKDDSLSLKFSKAASDASEKKIRMELIKQLRQFLASPFKDDQTYGTAYIAQMTRYKQEKEDSGKEEIINKLYFDQIFNFIIHIEDIEDPKICSSFDILINLMDSTNSRKKLADENYILRVFEKMEKHIDDYLQEKGINEGELQNRLL